MLRPIYLLIFLCSMTAAGAEKSAAEFTFRSLGGQFFTYMSGDKKIYKCESLCADMFNLSPGDRIEFLDNFKIVEFRTGGTSRSCEVTSCHEIQK